MWTAVNFTAWTIILAPILLIDRWLDAIRTRNAHGPDQNTEETR
ncbi:MAG: hypothetical protein ACU0BF_10320 [Paracoccaceae bacterium]